MFKIQDVERGRVCLNAYTGSVEILPNSMSTAQAKQYAAKQSMDYAIGLLQVAVSEFLDIDEGDLNSADTEKLDAWLEDNLPPWLEVNDEKLYGVA